MLLLLEILLQQVNIGCFVDGSQLINIIDGCLWGWMISEDGVKCWIGHYVDERNMLQSTLHVPPPWLQCFLGYVKFYIFRAVDGDSANIRMKDHGASQVKTFADADE